MKLNFNITVGLIGSCLAQKWSSCSVSCGEGFKCWFDRGVPVCESCTVPCKAPVFETVENSENQNENRPFPGGRKFLGGRMFIRIPVSEIKLKQTDQNYPETVESIEEIELGTKIKQQDPDADLYTPWGQWGPCCPTSERIAEQTRSRACLDDQADGGTKCQDYRNKSYEKRSCKLTKTGSPYSQPVNVRGYRNRRSENFDWDKFYGSEMNFNTLWGNGFAGHDLPPEPTQTSGPMYGGPSYTTTERKTVSTTKSTTNRPTTRVFTTTSTNSWRVESRPYPITTPVPEVTETFSTMDMSPVYNFEKFKIEEEHPQANCPFMGYDFMPVAGLFEETQGPRSDIISDWGQWEEWGKCNSYSNRQIRLRKCVGDRYRCSAKDTYQSRGCEIPVMKTDEALTSDGPTLVKIKPEKRPYQLTEPEVDSPTERENVFDVNENIKSQRDPINIPEPGYNLAHCKTPKYQYYYKQQVDHCLTEGHCFVFRNWNTSEQDARRIPTLLDCFQSFGFSEKDKKTFLHRTFVLPKLKTAMYKKAGIIY